MLHTVLIFLGQLKDESVGEERHENLPSASGVEVGCEVVGKSVGQVFL